MPNEIDPDAYSGRTGVATMEIKSQGKGRNNTAKYIMSGLRELFILRSSPQTEHLSNTKVESRKST
jgi:hypothetical protein